MNRKKLAIYLLAGSLAFNMAPVNLMAETESTEIGSDAQESEDTTNEADPEVTETPEETEEEQDNPEVTETSEEQDTKIDTCQELISEIAKAGDHETEIKLSGEIVVTTTIQIPEGKKINLVPENETVKLIRGEGFADDMITVGSNAELVIEGKEDASFIIDGNQVASNGSLIAVSPDGLLLVHRNTVLQNNNTTMYGGAIRNNSGKLALCDVEIKNNIACYGGAIYSNTTILLGDMCETASTSVVISGNTNSDGEANDVYLDGINAMINATKPLCAGSNIPLIFANPAEMNDVAYASNATDFVNDVLPYLSVENSGYTLNEEGQLSGGTEEDPNITPPVSETPTPTPTPTEAPVVTPDPDKKIIKDALEVKKVLWTNHDRLDIEILNKVDSEGSLYCTVIPDGTEFIQLDTTGEGIAVPANDVVSFYYLNTETNVIPDGVFRVYIQVKYKDADGSYSQIYPIKIDQEYRPEPDPNASPTPIPTTTPDVTETPVPTEIPDVSQTPVPSGTPNASQTPVPSGTPDVTVTPSPSGVPSEGKISYVTYAWNGHDSLDIVINNDTAKDGKILYTITNTNFSKAGETIKSEAKNFKFSITNGDEQVLPEEDFTVVVNVEYEDGSKSNDLNLQIKTANRPAKVTRNPLVYQASDSTVTGLSERIPAYKYKMHYFTVKGAGTDISNPVDGDVKWEPQYWEAGGTKHYKDNQGRFYMIFAKDYEAEKQITINIVYQKYTYRNGSWEKGDTESLPYTITVYPSNANEDHELQNGSGAIADAQTLAAEGMSTEGMSSGDVQTSDTAPVGQMVGIMGGALLAMFLIIRKLFKRA